MTCQNIIHLTPFLRDYTSKLPKLAQIFFQEKMGSLGERTIVADRLDSLK
jgi:hypothetical protein